MLLAVYLLNQPLISTYLISRLRGNLASPYIRCRKCRFDAAAPVGWKLHQVLERSREAGHPVPSDEILAHIAPIAFRHINFRGIYRFPLERYLDRLLPSVLPRKIAAGAK